ncbi:MAG: hypothetical protein C0625_04370 [Arcobacter sp.]|nr:MAG: hypothetical protein C0625_04370 [Arcobacter sp.]
MNKFSLIATSLIFAGNLVAADSSFDEAIKSGIVSADVTLYGERQSNSGVTPDAGFTSGSIGLSYETGVYYGIKADVGFRANHDFSEVENGDYGEDIKSILHTANISYTNKYFNLTVGRQEIDLEWMGDFHEAVVLGTNVIPDTSVVLGYSNRIAVADVDAALEDFTKFNNDDGAYVFDVKYEGIKGLVINPYYYNADNIASWYGLKVDYDNDIFGITLHGAKSNEDVLLNDADIYHLEGRTNIAGLNLSLGYISTDNNSGAGSMTSIGDNINPFEDGNQVYEADADTTYLNLSYDLNGFELGALYGKTDYSTNKEKELNLTVDYSLTDNLTLGALYVDVDAENSADDYNRVALTLQYSF